MYTINEHALIEFVFAHYHKSLRDSKRALRFLHQIGFDDSDVIESLYLGFADRSLGQQLPPDNAASGAAARGLLRKLGLFKPSGHKLLRGCVVFPLLSQQQRVIGAYAFLLEPYERSGDLLPVSWVTHHPHQAAQL